MHVMIPLGLGIAAGVVGVSNLLRWLLDRYEKATLGVLLGLLLGAVVGLWPFQQGEPPSPGDVVKGRVVTILSAAEIEADDWPVQRFDPSAGQIAAPQQVKSGKESNFGEDARPPGTVVIFRRSNRPLISAEGIHGRE